MSNTDNEVKETFDEQEQCASTKETIEEEKKNSIYNIYNIYKEEEKRRRERSVEDHKVLRSLTVSKILWDSAKKFAFHSECSTSCLVEKALMEYIKKHAAELPVNVSFNLVAAVEPKSKPKSCGVRHCNDKAVGSGVYLPKNITYELCEFHLSEAKENPKEWCVSGSGQPFNPNLYGTPGNHVRADKP